VVRFNNESRTLSEWANLLPHRPSTRMLWRELKHGAPLNEVLGGTLDRGRGDWLALRSKVRKFGL
jgi:hypothetical protein